MYRLGEYGSGKSQKKTRPYRLRRAGATGRLIYVSSIRQTSVPATSYRGIGLVLQVSGREADFRLKGGYEMFTEGRHVAKKPQHSSGVFSRNGMTRSAAATQAEILFSETETEERVPCRTGERINVGRVGVTGRRRER